MATINSWNNSVTAANVTFNGGTMSIGTDSTDNAINIGTAASSGRTVTIGNTTAASVLALKFGTGDCTLASATGTIMTANDTGEIRRALQPAFLAASSPGVANVTGDGTAYTLGTSAFTEVFDQNADFNTNGTFTAPVTGQYMLVGAMPSYQPANTTGGTETLFSLVTSNRTYYGTQLPTRNRVTNFIGSNAYLSARVGALCDMDSGDTATSVWTDSGGGKTDIAISQQYSGYLAC